jgi:hypothetical protein
MPCPISNIIGLPRSDMYMMGRDHPDPPRVTLRVPQLATDYEIDVSMHMDVQNAFTWLRRSWSWAFSSRTPKDCRTPLARHGILRFSAPEMEV